ncbi:DUF1772 domain-containing protein [Vineibacter terrae]|uniref:DUF1772 domain-containing protein n=1 Tax=Vineibacter terrae TaxID=2586908 RepID=A0A5C8PE72_9HYPH|nr:DUF1772 domain-containing protein [Vineibacter terrae]
MLTRGIHFCAIILAVLALVPAGAHLLELPNKIGLSQADYFTVQAIYRGWSLLGIVLIAALLASLALSVLLRGQGAVFALALAAFLLMAATLVIFFVWTYPANQATQNWTVAPENWQALRAHWEYAHAASAILTFIALCCLALSALLVRR